LDEPPSIFLAIILLDRSVLFLIGISVLLFFSGWTSAVEAAFFSLNNDDIERLKNNDDDRESLAASLVIEPRLIYNMLAAIKYFILLFTASLTATFFSNADVRQFIPSFSVTGAVIVIAILFAVVGVIIPKIHGTKNALRVVRRNSKICRQLIRILTPIIKPLLRTSSNIEKRLDEKVEENTVEHMTQALQLATVDNEPIEGEKEILEGVVAFGTLTVRQVMRPKNEISFADSSLTFHELLDFIKKSGYSRIPVCRGSLDKVDGVLYIKDLLPFLEENNYFGWHKLLRPGYFVPEIKKIDALLKDFQEKRVHIALVVNHTGNTTGLITLEDIIEEIMGDINDEFDELGTRYQRLNESTYMFDAKISLHEFCKVLNIDSEIFHQMKGINDSLSQLLLEVNERLPAVGDEITIEPFTFIIESADNKRIKKVKVELHESKEK
jgi:gliding motility-associated protein GldE